MATNNPPAYRLSGYLKSLSHRIKTAAAALSGQTVCPVCTLPATQHGLCSGCFNDLSLLLRPHGKYCPLCARYSAGGTPCGHCQTKPPPQQATYAVCRYLPPLSSLIHHYKFAGGIHLHTALAQLLPNHPSPWPQTPQAVLAVPLSRRRLHRRGFNQSRLLAHSLAEHLQLPLLPQNTVKRRHRPPQSTLPEKARHANVRNVFTVCRPEHIRGRRILLVDDVVTTGATFSELAKTLHQSGAAAVYCLALAKPD